MLYSIFTNLSASYRYIIDNIDLALFIAGMTAIMWDFLGGSGDHPLHARANTAMQKLSLVLLLFPFGYLVYLFAPGSAMPMMPLELPNVHWCCIRGRLPSILRNIVLYVRGQYLSLDSRTVQLAWPGWAMDLKFSLEETPHLRFDNYQYNFAKGLDERLAEANRTGQVIVEFLVTSTQNSGNDDVNALFDGYETRLRITYKEDHAMYVYEFALRYSSFSIPLHHIPPQFLEGGTKGCNWAIEVPDFDDFQNFLIETLNPKQIIMTTQTLGAIWPKIRPRSYQFAVDLAKAKIFFLIPILESVSFQSQFKSRSIDQETFCDKRVILDSLTYISLDEVKILARDYRFILEACPNLKTMIINRPGEGFGAFELSEPAALVRAGRLATLHLTHCKEDIHDFLSASVVNLPAVEELVLTSYVPQSIGPAHIDVNWPDICVLKVSDTFGAHFISGCLARLPPEVIQEGLEIIHM
ncbi:hypothetical protein FB446DRAFT_788145 [Lentinula raphanica]|nr:hypothetical protein FB446DRAFT_788145 [Lentinula raphanica]